MRFCDGCPTRQLAMLADALGAEDAGREIRASGCSWWQALPVNRPDGTPDIVDGCLRLNLRQYLDAYGSDILLASGTIQEDRKEQQRALQAVEAAIEEHGGGAVLQALGQLGLRAAIGASTGEQRPMERDSPGVTPVPCATEDAQEDLGA